MRTSRFATPFPAWLAGLLVQALLVPVLTSLLVLAFATPASAITGVQTWAYQLQGIDIVAVAAAPSIDLVVIDYSADGMAAGEWSAAEIEQIRLGGKIPVAYISIGEAEDYRYYWDPVWETSPPPWLGPENPDWPGNFEVRFWDPDWQAIILAYIDRILAQGFDGLYMDIIDGYYYWSEVNPENPQADADMVQFVLAIRDHLTAAGRPDMLLIPQNGGFLPVEDDVAGILDDAYYSAIDAIGVEDIFHPGELDEDNPYAPNLECIGMLAEYLARGKTVLSVEYLTQPAAILNYTQAAVAEWYIPHVSLRALNVLSSGWPTGVPLEQDPGTSPGAPRNVVSPRPMLMISDAWPNPFNPRLRFSLVLDRPARLRVTAYDTRGRLVNRIAERPFAAGEHELDWEPRGLPSGTYLLRVTGPGISRSRSVVLVR